MNLLDSLSIPNDADSALLLATVRWCRCCTTCNRLSRQVSKVAVAGGNSALTAPCLATRVVFPQVYQKSKLLSAKQWMFPFAHVNRRDRTGTKL